MKKGTFFSDTSTLVPVRGFRPIRAFRSRTENAPKPLPDRAGLLIAPSGRLVEDRTPLAPLDALFADELSGETLLSTVIEVIDAAADDERITSIVLDLENLAGPSTSQAMEIIEALDRFSETGKPVIAIGDYFTQSQYLLASQADTVFLHPEGGVSLMGFGVYRTYLKQFLENIRVNFHVFRAGDNKSGVEPYMRDDMSPQEREVVGKWLNSAGSLKNQPASNITSHQHRSQKIENAKKTQKH